MSRVCQLTGKRVLVGHKISHSNRKTKKRFMPNLHEHRIWVPSLNRYMKFKLSHKALRKIDKKGIDAVLPELLEHVA